MANWWDDITNFITIPFNVAAGSPSAAQHLPTSLPSVGNWLNSLGGAIGSGIEGALVSFLHDLWDVILGPLEIIAGAGLAIVILLYAFKDDLGSLAMLIK
jgi:hypothetical protein